MTSPIFSYNEARGDLVRAVVARAAEATQNPLHTLGEAAFLEMRRLKGKEGPELSEWRSLARSLGRLSEAEQRGHVERLCRKYAEDIAGHFNPKVFRFATKVGAPLISLLLAPSALLKNFPGSLAIGALDGRVEVSGPVETIQKLCDKGTVVYTPTHLSNLDSIVFGFALERAGLAPATYGAGKNLFTNPVLSFFMENLGAYRVDRRLRHALYKDVLKTYSCVLIERGYHSLFFPGGTRSRSGGVERRLKLGLAGTGIEAFSRTAEAGKAKKVFFVPSTINYLLTLEAETLIDDYLQEEGKHRYIIEDDESAQLGTVAAFMQKILSMDAGCVIRFGDPVDCFGNRVDEEGRSYDRSGRAVDPVTYVETVDGIRKRDPVRDAEYTRELGTVICEAFRRDTVLFATHLVAAAAFEWLRDSLGKRADLFALLRRRDDAKVGRDELVRRIQLLRERCLSGEAAGEVQLGKLVRAASPSEILEQALKAFASYHTVPVLAPDGATLQLCDTRLLFYYQNRLAAHGYAFDALAPKDPRLALSGIERLAVSSVSS